MITMIQPVLADGAFAGQGPLAGLAAGLAWAAGSEALISVPCDTPVLPADVLARLLPAPRYARAGGRDHYLVASWPVAGLPLLLAQLRETDLRRVGDYSRALGAVGVEFAAEGGCFANINRPEDLDALENGVR